MTITSADIHAKLREFFGYDAFKGDQERVIQHLCNGGDAFVLMPTGGGKSLCYQLPALLLEGTAIVISPLIALMKNQVDAIRGFVSGNEGIAHFLNSSLTKQQIDEVREDILSGTTKLLYVAPESLTKWDNIALLKEIRISFFAIDEAHCISEWGHDFRPEYRRIRKIVDEIGRAPLIALTATATPKVQADIQKNLGMMDAMVFKSSFNRPNLYYEVREKSDPKRDIIKFIRSHPHKSGIVYCLSRKKVEEIAQGYQTFTLLIMIAMFASLAALTMMPMHGVNGFVKFTAVFPLTSFFILPGLLISGELSVAFAIPATLLSVLATIFLFWFIARVYESAIVASGKVLKLPDLIKMAKNANGKGGKVNEK